MPQRLMYITNWSYDHFWNLFVAFFFGILAYFAKIKGPINVMLIAFLVDLLIGIIASIQVKKQKFSMEKAFIAFERMAIALIVVMLLYAMDKEMKQDLVSIYNFVAYVITGFLIYSIGENGYRMTGGRIFLIIKTTISKKVKDNTGIDFDEETQSTT